jgi:hypothetical protein
MSQNDPLAASQAHRPPHQQQRALQKELLLLRSEMHRAEILNAVGGVRRTVTGFAWVKSLVPGVSARRLLRSTKHLNANIGGLFEQYPLLSSLVTMALAEPLRKVARRGAAPAVKWGGVALAAWQSRKLWKKMIREIGLKRDK